MNNRLPSGVELFEFAVHGDQRGSLIAGESGENIPFNIERVYTLFNTTHDMVRGCHAHKKMKQLIINVTGSFKLTVDDGVMRKVLEFDDPGKGVFINGLVWRELSDFSKNSVINCFADKLYKDCIYISDYQQFLEEVDASR